mmetsp:Transcript_29034/g.25643  ORF Transcript_29034/g.25643 Transcript_29034/m.25643 type:complete len:235 (-) Transcript_29034:32-736(-)|eukprot:CAMPEP_0201588980 /NCGR_PEP_ID=MMETSP0190_2-20130828/161340_1 /ASSEMBLY_ACC=CAM_ASM_000263 /TAXON_ID=37353 /ORGANISM="Rosalina sp." /LENGTH=234 /DNA_ID=CAMNT_0048042197 /DNA_START=70 /DNA_END=774 /DNA_ORIENTATION=+
MERRTLLVISLSLILFIDNIECHTYRLNYHNEEQSINIVKDGQQTELHFGDIVEIGNDRRIVYLGNGKWRENDNPTNKQWPDKIHHFDAEDIEGFPEFVKTGFEVLDNQLDKNEGWLDVASASAKEITYDDQIVDDQNVNNTNFFQNKIIIGVASMAFFCLLHVLCMGVICVGCKALCNKAKKTRKYDFNGNRNNRNNDRLPSMEYQRIDIQHNEGDSMDEESGDEESIEDQDM